MINYRYHTVNHALEEFLWDKSGFKTRSEELSILSIDRYYGPRQIGTQHKLDFWEMGCIVKGAIDFYCGGCRKLDSDTVFMIPSNTLHGERCVDPADMIFISFCGNLLNEKVLKTYASVKNHELACMIERLWMFTEIKEAGTGPEIDAKIMEIVSRFFRILKFGHSPQNSDMIEKAITYIHSHMAEQISIPDIAEKTGCSQTYFRRLFKMRTGRSPVEYIQKIRLQHAKSLLKNTNMQITEIANSVGHNDAFYFSRVFKKAFGINPRSFRNSIDNILYSIHSE